MATYSRAGQFGPAAISGAPAGAPLRVQDAAGSDAVLYRDASKNKTAGPIVYASDAGQVTFFADPGTYTVRWTGGSTTVAVTGGTLDGADGTAAALTSNFLASGEETFSRELFTTASAVTLTTQVVRMAFFTARKTEVTTQVRTFTGTTAAAATPTLCRIGLYLFDGSGNASLVAATANDTTLWSATSTAYTRSWATAYTKVAGQRYALGLLCISSAAVPTIGGTAIAQAAEAAQAPAVAGIANGTTDLPSSIAAGGFTATGVRPYAAILP